MGQTGVLFYPEPFVYGWVLSVLGTQNPGFLILPPKMTVVIPVNTTVMFLKYVVLKAVGLLVHPSSDCSHKVCVMTKILRSWRHVRFLWGLGLGYKVRNSHRWEGDHDAPPRRKESGVWVRNVWKETPEQNQNLSSVSWECLRMPGTWRALLQKGRSGFPPQPNHGETENKEWWWRGKKLTELCLFKF